MRQISHRQVTLPQHNAVIAVAGDQLVYHVPFTQMVGDVPCCQEGPATGRCRDGRHPNVERFCQELRHVRCSDDLICGHGIIIRAMLPMRPFIGTLHGRFGQE